MICRQSPNASPAWQLSDHFDAGAPTITHHRPTGSGTKEATSTQSGECPDVPDPSSVTELSPPQHPRTGIPKWIRTFAIPIIIGWIALVALLSVTVPPLEVVGQMRSVSMSPSAAPSVIAMKRVGQVFDEFK